MAQEQRLLVPKTRLMERYEIVGVLGKGGMSTVYKARDLHFPQLHKWVAIKEMTVAVPREREEVFHTFEREAHLLAQLRHPSIPVVYDYFTLGDKAYLVLEYIEGKTLTDVLNETADFLSEERVLNWAIQICDVLEYLHSRRPPIIFRDLKPSNIMVNAADHIFLIDFGIARIFDPKARGTIIGTEGYAPPEQYRGVLSPLVDIYALGATLHHLLSKQDPRKEPPFTFAERPIRKFNPHVSPELEAVIYKALAYRPEDRFQNATEMKEALIQVMAQHYGEEAVTRVLRQTRNLETAPQKPLEDLSETRATPHIRTGTLLTKTLPETDVLSTGTLPPDTRVAPGIVGQVAAPQPVWTFTCEDEIRSTGLVVGDTLFIGSYDHNLYALHTETGEMRWKFPTEGGVVSRPAWDGRRVFFGSQDGHIYAVYANGQLAWKFATQAAIHSSPRLNGDLLFIGSDAGYLYAFHAETGRLLWYFNAGAPVRSTPWAEHGRVYFGTEAGELFCLDIQGKEQWRHQTNWPFTSSPIVAGKTLYIGGRDGFVYALDAESGWVLWKFRMGRGTLATPVFHQGFLYIGAADGVLYRLNAQRGREVWRFQTKHQIAGSVCIVGDRLYFGATDHHLYCLDVKTGFLLWAYRTGGPITGTPVTDAQARLLFIGSFDKRVYAFPLR